MARRVSGTAGAGLSVWNKISTRSQSNLYFALFFLDRAHRDDVRDVYRFARAVDDAADAAGDPEQGVRRLAAWRQELDAIYADRATHPYGQRLARVVWRHNLSRQHFEAMLAGLELDVLTPRLASYQELHAYCEAVASSLGYLYLEILGMSGPAERCYARDVGVALQLANILRDIDEDAARGHIYLPMDELAGAGVRAEDVLQGRMSAGLAAVCRRLAARARGLIAGARAGLAPGSARRLLVPEIWADVYLALLEELERVNFDVMGQKPYLHRRRKLKVALRRWAMCGPRAWARRFFPLRPRMW